MNRFLSIFFALIASCLPAMAQTGTPTKQSGNVTPTHASCWTTNGIVQDCGTAAIPFLTTIGTVYNGPSICAWSALSTAPGSQRICLGATDAGGAQLSVQNFGTDSALPLSFLINGTAYQFPYTIGGVVGPNSSVVGDLALWNNTVGSLLKDGGGGIVNGIYGWANDQYFSGRPFCDPIEKGALPNGVANSLTAFNACLSALGSGGGTIWLNYIPGTGGLYCLKGASQATIFNINVPVRLIFASSDVSLSSCGSGFSTLEISAPSIIDGAAGGTILGPGLDGEVSFGASEPTLILTSGAGSTKLMNLVVYGGSPTIQWNCGECQAYNVDAAFAYAGNASGIVAEWLFQNGGGELYNTSADDNEYPYGIPTPPFTYTAWATNQSVATNAVRTATCQDGNSYVIQAKVGGTTASSGTGPTCKNYGGISQVFTDGTVQWSLSHPTFLYHWQADTGTADLHIHQADTGGGYVGFALTNTLSGNPPTAVSCVTCNGGVSYFAQVDGIAGNTNIVFLGSLFSGCLEAGCSAIRFETGFIGGVAIVGGNANQSPIGISILGGSNYRINGVDMTSNTTALFIAGSASNVAAIGNNFKGASTAIAIADTASDIVATDNVGCANGSSTCAASTSTGSNIITSPNDDGTAYQIVPGTTKLPGTNGDVEYNNNGVLGEISSATTVDGQTCALGSSCQTAIAGQSDYTATTWTPAVTASSTAGTPAYTTRIGSYEKLGRQITIRFNIVLSGWTGSPSGNVTITGLPVAAANTANDLGVCFLSQWTVTSSSGVIAGTISPNTSAISLTTMSSTTSSALTASNAGTTPAFAGYCSYHT